LTEQELQTVSDLHHVRAIKHALEFLDPSVGPIIPDEEHAQLRRTVRAWEQKLQAQVKIRKERADKNQSRLELEEPKS